MFLEQVFGQGNLWWAPSQPKNSKTDAKPYTLFKSFYTDPGAEQDMAASLASVLEGYGQKVLVICIGTDSNIGDALGPLVGTFLKERGSRLPVYGTLDSPVHAQNLVKQVGKIKSCHAGYLHIAVDASLSRQEEVGVVEIRNGGLYPGRALNKSLPQVGHISILGKVGVYIEEDGIRGLYSGRLGLVYQMASFIAQGILLWEKEQDW